MVFEDCKGTLPGIFGINSGLKQVHTHNFFIGGRED